MLYRTLALTVCLFLCACPPQKEDDYGGKTDASADAGSSDAGDASAVDSSHPDATVSDSSVEDSSVEDSSVEDSGLEDSGLEDSSVEDSGLEDSGLEDSGVASGACNDGVDNDGDGLIDWQLDFGCANALDDDETAAPRDQEGGFTTFDKSANSRVVFVSASGGNDNNDGSTPQLAVATLSRGADLVRDGENDFLLLRRGDVWRGESLDRFKSGLDATHPLVVGAYGDAGAYPRIEISDHLIDHNGRARSYVALVGLEIVAYHKIPGDSEFDGATGGGLRYVGGGEGLLVEGCHLRHCELVVQSYDVNHYDGVEIRRNVIELSYHTDTCGQNSTYRPSGMYASHVDNLTIEGNLFDHNGWNEDVASACATMYNHNMYLNADGLIIRDNIIARASSMGIKMRSDQTGDADNLLFENNLFVDGEIGLGIGGNTSASHRFSNVRIRNNVFAEIGVGNPTNRNFSWMLDMADLQVATVEGNYFIHQPWYTNAYGIKLGSGSETDITITGNTFYNLRARSLDVSAQSGWSNVMVSANTFVDPTHGSCLVDHEGGFSAVQYRDNVYASASGNDWFCVEGQRRTLSQWASDSGETGATTFSATFVDPDRTVATYAATLGLTNSLEAFLEAARGQSRQTWRTDLTADSVNDYIRAGFVTN